MKTNYRDAMCDGARKYRFTTNPDGTVGIMDVTNYTQEGDRFGSNDINDTNKAVNKLLDLRTLTLTATGWSTSYPYVQTLNVAGVMVNDNIRVIGVYIPDGATLDQIKAWNKAAGYLICNPNGVSEGKVTFKAYKKPAIDFQIITEGG